MAAAEERWTGGRWSGQRVTLRTAAFKFVVTFFLLVCGASIGREGPTVQVVAGILRSLTRGLKGGPGRRAIIIAGGAAGVAAAFNAPIAGVVFAVEELARKFEVRTHTTVILVVVICGFTSYALQGDYAYFGVLDPGPVKPSIWLAAPLIAVAGGLLGGLFSRSLAYVIGPSDNPVARWRRLRPVLFAFLCGLVAALVAWVSGGITFGAGYNEAKSLLQDHPGRGFSLAVAKFLASLAAAASGGPGGIFAPRALATGAGIGAAFARSGLIHFAGRERRCPWDVRLSVGRGAVASHQRRDPDGDDPRARPCGAADAHSSAVALDLWLGHARADLPRALAALAAPSSSAPRARVNSGAVFCPSATLRRSFAHGRPNSSSMIA